MPEPVFRSTVGQDPREAPAEGNRSFGSEDVTEIPEIKMENESKSVVEPVNDPEAADAIQKEIRGDKLGLSLTAIGLISLLIAGIAFLLFYFLFFRSAIPSTQ